MSKQNIHNMDLLTGRKASVGYRVMVKPNGRIHVKDDVPNVMMAVDGRISITADSTEFDYELGKQRRAEKSTITIRLGNLVVFCGGTEKLVTLLTGNNMTEIPESNVLD